MSYIGGKEDRRKKKGNLGKPLTDKEGYGKEDSYPQKKKE